MPGWLQSGLQGGVSIATIILITGGAIALLVVLYRSRNARVLVRGLLLGGQSVIFLLLLLSAPRVHPTGEIVFTLGELLNAVMCVGGVFWFWVPFAARTAPTLVANPTIDEEETYQRETRQYNRARRMVTFQVAGNVFASGLFFIDVVNRIAPFGWGIPSFLTVLAALVLVGVSSFLFYR